MDGAYIEGGKQHEVHEGVSRVELRSRARHGNRKIDFRKVAQRTANLFARPTRALKRAFHLHTRNATSQRRLTKSDNSGTVMPPPSYDLLSPCM